MFICSARIVEHQALHRPLHADGGLGHEGDRVISAVLSFCFRQMLSKSGILKSRLCQFAGCDDALHCRPWATSGSDRHLKLQG